MSRPLGPIERAWSGAGGAAPWTRTLEPAAWLYGAAAARARASAARRRARLTGVRIVAVGGLTIGGSGKSSVVRWLARDLSADARVAVLLRGYGSRRRAAGGAFVPAAELVPDYAGLDPVARVARYGDDALAHRAALPPDRAAVVVGVDRLAAARAAIDGFGAETLLLDDGWEQPGLAWDALIAVLDPDRPAGNGALLPAGPLRRPAATLREASCIVLIHEDADDPSAATGAFLARHAPAVPVARLRRTLVGLDPPVDPGGAQVGLVSGVGSPGRLDRFARAQGFHVAGHAAFTNHAEWTAAALGRAAAGLARAGAVTILITEKDAPRWPASAPVGLPVRVIRTGLTPVAPADASLLRRMARGEPSPLAAAGRVH